jgi:hypothetical protein
MRRTSSASGVSASRIEILRPSGENELRRADYFAHARDAYRMEVLGVDPEETEQPPIALQTGLDGVYWK